jgi:hypothetical protein
MVVSDADNDWMVVSYYLEESRHDDHHHHYSNCRHHAPKIETALLLVKRCAFAFNLYRHPMWGKAARRLLVRSQGGNEQGLSNNRVVCASRFTTEQAAGMRMTTTITSLPPPHPHLRTARRSQQEPAATAPPPYSSQPAPMPQLTNAFMYCPEWKTNK